MRSLLYVAFPLLAGIACGVSASTPSVAGSTGSNDVPITITQVSASGTMRFSVPIQIGGSPPFDVFLDTGSSGLRVLAGAVPDSAIDHKTAIPITYTYHSGLMIQGVVAFANVTLGTMTTPSPIPIMLIEQVGCTPQVPTCNAAGKTVTDYTFFGPYKAILGVGMRSKSSDNGVGSPIAQLAGHPSFIVHAPAYGGTSGLLRIGPAADIVAQFKTYSLPGVDGGAPLPDGTPTWNDRGLPSCVDDETGGTNYCLPAEFDTGNPPTYIEWPAHTQPNVTTLPSGTKIAVTIGPPSAPLGHYDFTVGATPTPGVDAVEVEPATSAGFMNLGTAVFFHYDVLFDQQHGVQGFAPH